MYCLFFYLLSFVCTGSYSFIAKYLKVVLYMNNLKPNNDNPLASLKGN